MSGTSGYTGGPYCTSAITKPSALTDWPVSTTGQAAVTTDTGRSGPRSDPHNSDNVLVITGLSRKNKRHYGPLAAVAEQTTLVALDPPHDIDDARYVEPPAVGPRPLRVLCLLFVALYEGYRHEYDAVVSISLVPYGLYALILKAVYGYPAHLGIIGIDLDHHAEQWYGDLPRWAFRRFDAVSVPGSVHAGRLIQLGVSPDRIEILTNAIDTDQYEPPADEIDPTYEFMWIGRFSDEKDPLRFAESLITLDQRGAEFNAVMVGDGPLRSAVENRLADHGLADRVTFPGWVDDPLTYYHQSRVFVLTSRRDALPLALVEAMATGTACITPRVGSVPTLVADGKNGLIVDTRTPAAFAAAMERCLDEPAYCDAIATAGMAVRSTFSMDQAEADWRRILQTVRE